MAFVAARNQSLSELFDSQWSIRLSRPSVSPSDITTKVAFVGFAVWRREENGDGNLSDEQVFVIRNGVIALLNPRFDLANHSPDGFSWGYNGSGPAQLALAMLMQVFTSWNRVQPIYQLFKERFVAHLPQHTNWLASGEEVAAMAAGLSGGTLD